MVVYIQVHITLQNVSQAARENMLLDADHAYHVLLQYIKDCQSSLVQKLTDNEQQTDQPSGISYIPLNTLFVRLCFRTGSAVVVWPQ